MKKFSFYSLISTLLFLVFSFSSVSAQLPGGQPPEPDNPPPAQRPNLLEELNLSADQIQQMRRLNQERRPEIQAAQLRLREANRALDAAVYADVENESEIQNRMKEVQAAQAEMVKNRTIMERAIRRILTPQQLARFRELREQFMHNEPRQNRMNNRRKRLKNMPQGFPRRRVIQNRNN